MAEQRVGLSQQTFVADDKFGDVIACLEARGWARVICGGDLAWRNLKQTDFESADADRGGAGDDGGDSSRGDGKGSHDYWFCVRSKMASRIAPGLLLVYRWNLDSHGMLRLDWPNCRGLSAAERTKS